VKHVLSPRSSRDADARDVDARDSGAFGTIEALLRQRRFEDARDAAKALFERRPRANSLQAYLYALERLGDDWTIEELLHRPDVAAIVNTSAEPYLRGALANSEARGHVMAASAPPGPMPGRRIAPGSPPRVGYFLHNALPFASGGYAIRSHEIARSMRGAGYACTVFPRSGFPGDSRPDAAGLDTSPRTIDDVPYVYSDGPRKDAFIYRYMEESSRHYEALIRSHSLDIVHAASNHLVALPAALAARRQGIPFVYEVRSFWEMTRVSWDPEYAGRPEARRNDLLEQRCLELAQAVLTLNDPMADRLVGRKVSRESLFVLPNCVDATRLTPRPRHRALAGKLGIGPKDVVVGYVGTFVQYEGLDILIRAFAKLRDSTPGVKLLLVGDDRPQQVAIRHAIGAGLRDLVGETGLTGDVIFTGRVPFAEIADYYSLIDICPFPRRRDEVCQLVSPLKPLEALAMQKCVLVSDVGGMKDLVEDGVTGLRFESENVEALASRLLAVVRQPGLRRALSEAGRKWVEGNRTWEAMQARLQRAYAHAHARLVADAKGSRGGDAIATL
jgi:glycosyltransferase involved in cell wall biosynthesis